MRFAIIATLLFTFTFAAQSQTAEEIVATYLENIGGEDNLRAIKGVKTDGEASFSGMKFPMSNTSLADGRTITTLEFQGKTLTQDAFDGETLWGVNFMTQKNEKQDDEATENKKREAKDVFLDPFIDYKKKGFKIELLANETVEGTECFQIKLTKKPLLVDGNEEENVEYYFFDTEDFVPIMMKSTAKSGPAKGITSKVIYSDYDEVDGIYFAMSLSFEAEGGQGGGGSVTFNKIVLNPTVDDEIFKYKEAE